MIFASIIDSFIVSHASISKFPMKSNLTYGLASYHERNTTAQFVSFERFANIGIRSVCRSAINIGSLFIFTPRERERETIRRLRRRYE